MSKPENRKKAVFIIFFLIYFILTAGCATDTSIRQKISNVRISDDFFLVKTTAEDTFSTLAARYLGDPHKGWLIAEFNATPDLVPGQNLIIPLSPFNKAGLKPEGYQVVPVLVYHGFSEKKSGKTMVSRYNFDAQMNYLKKNGYHIISLDQLLNFIDYKEQIPEKSVAITLDDGWRSIYNIAFPILKKYGFPATFFIYTDFIGGGKAMSWKDIKEITENGFDVQCQTKTHRNLTALKKNESFRTYFKDLEIEMRYPQKLIKKKLNQECKYLAYPYGKTNDLVIAVLKKEGYRAAFTLDWGSNPFFVDKYRIRRCVIYGDYDIERFKKCLSVFRKYRLK